MWKGAGLSVSIVHSTCKGFPLFYLVFFAIILQTMNFFKGVQTFVAKENREMARILQNKDMALLFGVFRS